MIEASGLTKRYDKTLAVDDLSFSIRPGKVTGFLGPNGSGKSTTMRMILGLDRPTEGDVRIDGKHYRDLAQPLSKVGAMLDAKWTHPNRSARAHLSWLAKSNRLPARRADEVLEIVGLSAVARRRAGGFSLGMAQRLGIAAALLGDPEILLFDEPVNGLDPEGILWIRQLMQRLAAEGRTILVSSHLLSEMALTAQELVVIGRGRLIAQCSTAEFVDQASDTTVRVRSPQRDRLRSALRGEGITAAVSSTDANELIISGSTSEQIGELAAAAGVVLHELTAQRASLEEAFLALTNESLEYQARSERKGELVGVGTASAARQEENR
ncbi:MULTISPECIES: ABC transporter ATP-binding protein [Actinoalloteichus]|uniref:ABC-type multidrug transport system, ATPase component n=1 Tax=Actinoalloteichus fjordicus TaxID=1612552 RepID=A0AAC9LJI8_9PSEU|nr:MULTISPECIES: ABC transporter ATP-binding protein [Actinoalloteichus]APU17904.1 ABC-type multidrug transport system, ATPase component [Actinoalloteichus fjordicus]APU23982.1 ABC-type multidrug transport system, ATPase component [Actinoalloteichus sp. GBA129-24]